MAERARRPGSGSPLLRSRLLRDWGRDRGQVIVMFAVVLPVLLGFGALIIDVGHAFLVKRHLQNAADAASIAAAWELPDQTAATAVGNLYSASAGGKNVNSKLPTVTTQVTFPATAKVKVTQTATSGVFFGGVLPFGGFNVSASAVASRVATPVPAGTPYAIFVHELCGASTGNKGLNIAGDNARIEGAIHVNGQFKIGNPGFQSFGATTVYRPPDPPSVPPPNQPGLCDGSGNPKITNHATAKYNCSDLACTTWETSPTHGTYQDWATLYARNGTAYTKAEIPCSSGAAFNPSGDLTFNTIGETIPSGVYCLQPGKQFKVDANNITGNITIFADKIFVGGRNTVLRPFNPAKPVLFYNTAADEMVLNASGAIDWEGYIINRFGGITVNAPDQTSPQEGLLESEWLVVNGATFRMLGQGPPAPGGTTIVYGDAGLEE